MNTLMIATVKAESEIQLLIDELKSTAVLNLKLIISSSRNSVAYNVNRALEQAVGQYVIKVDDDITGFGYGWDAKLIEPFMHDDSIEVISARLLNRDGSPQFTCSRDFNLHPRLVYLARPIVPFCCVAFKNNGIRMDESYIGSGYDDADYCQQIRLSKNNPKFVINNEVRLIHLHEQKNVQLEHNSKYFRSKWNAVNFPDGKGLME